MNRQFHSKTSIRNYVLLAALLSVAIYFVWHTDQLSRQVSGLVLVVILLLMVLIVERMVHTTYTLTKEHTLVIDHGKLSRPKVIPLHDIDRIDRINRLRFGGKPLITSLVIVLHSGTEYYITPRNEEDFIQCIIQRKQQATEEEEE